ncbi:MAG: transcriptional repressor [Candidatus Saccharibacteria bacterium]
MPLLAVQQRETKYCRAIRQALRIKGHATNSELLALVRKSFPDVSATTIHRATARLAARAEISLAPAALDGAMRYDATATPHDHFLCSACAMLRDTDVKNKVIPLLEASIGDCSISGQLTISGICQKCSAKGLA